MSNTFDWCAPVVLQYAYTRLLAMGVCLMGSQSYSALVGCWRLADDLTVSDLLLESDGNMEPYHVLQLGRHVSKGALTEYGYGSPNASVPLLAMYFHGFSPKCDMVATDRRQQESKVDVIGRMDS